MASLSIIARYPTLTYLGHHGAGQRSDFPDSARLHAALTHAASTGTTAVECDGHLTTSADAAVALRWLEEHPPSALMQPTILRVAEQGALSWRNEGVLESPKQGMAQRKTRKPQSSAVTIDGPFGWAWDEDVPEEVVNVLRTISEDVSCLGDAETPAIIELAPISPTHLRDMYATAFSRKGIRVRTPLPGRSDELEAAHQALRPAKRPTSSMDKHSWSQQPARPLPPTSCVTQMVYQSVAAPPATDPWDIGLAIRIITDQPLQVHEHVGWAVAFHRALASRMGDDAPSVITGRYLEGVEQPANRVAIQIVDQLPGEDEARQHFVVMAPNGMLPQELALLERAVRSLSYVACRGTRLDLGLVTPLDPTHFWPEPAAGSRRYWMCRSAMVAETRRQTSAARWTLADSALLAVGHVIRDRLDISYRHGGYRAIVQGVAAREVKVVRVHSISDSRVERYAHKLPSGVTAQPYTAMIDIAGVISPTALFALGQSRHLGGGLMVPVDVPEAYDPFQGRGGQYA